MRTISTLSLRTASASSSILIFIPFAFHWISRRQSLLLTSAFLAGVLLLVVLLSVPALLAFTEQLGQRQEPACINMSCSPRDSFEQLLWQRRLQPQHASWWVEKRTTFSHCRHRFWLESGLMHASCLWDLALHVRQVRWAWLERSILPHGLHLGMLCEGPGFCFHITSS